MIPVLRRLSGAILAQAEQARLALENAYRAWRNSDESAGYLLKGRELRRVSRYARDFHWGRDREEKRRFLDLSRRRRRRIYSGLALFLVIGAGWQWVHENRHADDLERWKLPADLYRYHHQLETLILDSGYLTHLRWLERGALDRLPDPVAAALRGQARPERSLQTLGIYAPVTELPDLPDTLVRLDLVGTGLDGLHSLRELPSLESLTLENIDSLAGLLGELPRLQSLTLQINYSLTSLAGLPDELPGLQSLEPSEHRLPGGPAR